MEITLYTFCSGVFSVQKHRSEVIEQSDKLFRNEFICQFDKFLQDIFGMSMLFLYFLDILSNSIGIHNNIISFRGKKHDKTIYKDLQEPGFVV